MNLVTEQLKRELWRRFGTREHPAEWDGHVYGGGKLSQRYWEYFKAIELLDLTPESVVLDLGGGSPQTGIGFFAALLATAVRQVFVFDEAIAPNATVPPNVILHRQRATFESLQAFLIAHPEITQVACVSVLEHIEPTNRRWLFQALNDHFQGSRIVLTLEYHAQRTFFEHQLTTATLSHMVQPLTVFYPDVIEASPVWCQNAFSRDGHVPHWYPLALRLMR